MVWFRNELVQSDYSLKSLGTISVLGIEKPGRFTNVSAEIELDMKKINHAKAIPEVKMSTQFDVLRHQASLGLDFEGSTNKHRKFGQFGEEAWLS